MEIFTNENLLLQMEFCRKPCPAYDFIAFPLRRDLDKRSAWDWGILLAAVNRGQCHYMASQGTLVDVARAFGCARSGGGSGRPFLTLCSSNAETESHLNPLLHPLPRPPVPEPSTCTVIIQAMCEQKNMTAVGFEPTQLALVELESTPLDHSGKLSLSPCHPSHALHGDMVPPRS